MLTVGQIVISKSGRDKNHVFIIASLEDDYVYLVDGKIRTLSNCKKKKVKHIQLVKKIVLDVQFKLQNNEYLLDSDIRKAIKAYKEPNCIGNKEVNNLV